MSNHRVMSHDDPLYMSTRELREALFEGASPFGEAPSKAASKDGADPVRSTMSKFCRFAEVMDTGRPLPKFGEWDVNDPSSADSFTVIFNKARDERKTGSNNQGSNSPGNELSDQQKTTHATSKLPSGSRKWFCCLKTLPAES